MSEGAAAAGAGKVAVYRLYDAEGSLLYVGVSKNYIKRWQQHKQVKSWWPQVCDDSVQMYPDAESALQAEKAAIRSENPVHNIALTNRHYRPARALIPFVPQKYMGSAEIGLLLKVSRQRVHQLTSRPGFPEPYDVLAMGKVWKRVDVEAWARTRERLIYDSEPGNGH